MDTLGFLRAILPDEGVYYLALFKAGQKGPAHIAFTSLEKMAAAVAQADQRPGVAVYHACAAYNEPFIEIDGRKSYRKPPNWNRAKALWVDIDCGEAKAAAGEGYPDKKSAWVAMRKFCATTGFPEPMVVDSGNGIHCYWPLTKAIRAPAWQALAFKLRDVLGHFDILVDNSCTTDFARVLRPPGSTNRKRDPKSVVVRQQVEPSSPELLRDLLSNIVSTFGIVRKELPPNTGPSINDDLVVRSDFADMESSAVEVANRCMQVGLMRDTKGDVSYEHWRGVIGIIKHCVEGVELAHEWSEERANTGHESVDVDTRYNTWSAGPTTCEFFSKSNPGGCDGCQHKGKVTSPIILGRIVPEPKVEVVEATVDGESVEVEVPAFPEGFEWKKSMMVRHIKDKDGIFHPYPFCKTLFYPTHRVHNEDGTYSIGIRAHLPDKRTRTMNIDTGLLASPQKLMEKLGSSAEIVQSNDKDSAMNMTAYLRESLEALKTKSQELSTMTCFGWKDDGQSFLIGDRLYLADGSMRRVLVGGFAADHIAHFPEPRGTLDGYATALNHIYGRKGMEPMQYTIASGFGSLLTPFGESNYRGLLVALTSGNTGRGKTTVCRCTLSAFGDSTKMTIKTPRGVTVNALYAQMGTYGSTPMLFDEFGGIEPAEFSEFAYRVSLGEEKGRMKQTSGSGLRMATPGTWHMSPYLTGNKDFHGILAAHSPNAQAESVRLIQIKTDEYEIPIFEDGVVAAAEKQMELNRGTAGEAFIRYVVMNRDAVWTEYQEMLTTMSKHIPGPKFRFYRNHAAATLTAVRITNDLGITSFDLDRLTVFTVELMRKLAKDVKEANMLSTEDALSTMINDLTPRFITTTGYRDPKDALGPERPARVYGTIAGRYIAGSGNKKEPMAGRLYIIKKEVRDWCMSNRVEMKNVLSHAHAQGVLIHEDEPFTVTKGTELPTVNLKCVVLDMNKMGAEVKNTLKLVSPNPVDDSEDMAVAQND